MGMSSIKRFVRRLAFTLRSRRHAADLAAEMEYHRCRIQADLEADGIPTAEAAARSRRAMGNVTLAREDSRDVWIAALLHRLWRDAIYGARALRREPIFAATVLLTLTLGITTTTTVFSVVDAELWRPLPFKEPGQLIVASSLKPGTRGEREGLSGPDLLDWQAQSRLAEYAAEGSWGRRVLRRNGVESVLVQAVTPNYFDVLAHAPRMGRAFSQAQDGHARSAVLSDAGWRRVFGADPQVLGSVITLDEEDYTVVGVNAGQHFEMGREPDVFVTVDPTAGAYRDRSNRSLHVTGRIRSGVTMAQAQAELEAIATRIAEMYPADHVGHGIELSDLRLSSSGYNWRPLFFFLGAASLVLVLSGVNAANLLLARALRRQREFAIRGAMGGGRRALARQLVVEGALLAIPSAAAGALLSSWGLRLFVSGIPEDYLARGGHFGLNARVTIFVALLSGVITVLLSLAPMVFARRVDLNVMLGHGGRSAGGSRRQVRLRHALLVAQLTLTLVLLTGAGLFAMSFLRLVQVPLGFEPRDVLSVRVSLTGPRYEAGDAPVRAFADALLEKALATPGVSRAAIDTSSALDSGPTVRLVAADRPRPQPSEEPSAIIRGVTADYFGTLGITLRAGRPFAKTDTDGAPRVAVINEYLASRLFHGENPVGQRIELVPGARTPWTRRPGVVLVVGVAPNVKDVGVNEVEFGNIYVPFAQAPSSRVELVVKAAVPAATLAGSLKAAVATIDPALPVSRIETFATRVETVLKSDRFNVLLIGGFAVVGLLLAAVGVYGAMACAVQERTREFGIRLALGQQPGAIVRSTLWRSARFGLYGAAIGLGLVLVIARILGNALYLVRGEHTGLLYGVTTTDPIALGGALAGLILVAAISGVVPARNAARLDPLVALRAE